MEISSTLSCWSALSPLAFIIAGIVSMGVGALWYSPLLFGKVWMKAAGVTEEQMGEVNMTKSYVVGIVMAILNAALVGLVYQACGAKLCSTVSTLLFIWLFFVIEKVGVMLWEGKPFSLYCVNVFWTLVNFLVAAFIYASIA